MKPKKRPNLKKEALERSEDDVLSTLIMRDDDVIFDGRNLIDKEKEPKD